MLKRIWTISELLIFLSVMALVIIQEAPPPGKIGTRIDLLVADQTFNYLGWELDALYDKGAQASVPVQDYLPDQARKDTVLYYVSLVGQMEQQSQRVAEIYGDSHVTDPDAASASHRAEYERLRAEQSRLQSTVEAIIEDQVAAILAEQGFALGGQVVPPVKFRFTPLPQQLIISPRCEISRLYEFSLEAGLTVDRAEALEKEIDQKFDVASLVVPIGGMGLYPAMLLETSSLEWTVGVVAHEWAHNWLTLFPLGWLYGSSPQLTTMNETAASIVENEIRPLVLARFYPELVRPPEPAPSATPDATDALSTPEAPFDFRQEMRTTRAQVDRLLKEARIAEAEDYMKARRQVFWEHGYLIRKLNQAYFAFYGAYADEPGAAGEDPVGPAVVTLRQRSSTLRDFMLRLAPMTSFDDLTRAVSE